MKSNYAARNSEYNPGVGTLVGYVAGFVLSFILTMAAYLLVLHHVHSHHLSPSDGVALAIVTGLAISQFVVQLVFFLHLGRESKPRWNLVVFLFALMVVVILVSGSLWIMYNLNYHHPTMTPSQTDKFIIHDEGIH